MVNDTSSYMVDLFDVDVGFTADYSNVLDFENTTKRDEYFDSLHYIRLMNTNLNRVQISEYSIKVSFDSSNFIEPEKINYVRTYNQLKGSTNSKIMYYFVVDFTIINSYNNLTTIQFTIQNDIWTNYQFNFNLKESSIERAHIDRWGVDGSIKFTKPNNDALESYMKYKNKIQDITQSATFILQSETRLVADLALCVFTYTTSGTSKGSKLRIGYFPIPIATDYTNYILHDIRVIGTQIISHRYPTFKEVLSADFATFFDIAPSSIIDVRIILNSGIKINIENPSPGIVSNKIDGANELDILYGTNSVVAYFTGGDSSTVYGVPTLPWNTIYTKKILNKTNPIKPKDNDNYSNNFEPMLFRTPIMKRYISNGDATEIFEIPDIKAITLDTLYFKTILSAGTAYNIITLENPNLTGSIAYSSIMSAMGIITSYGCDVINNYWQEYCITQRDADRKMMYANILTGGIAEAGSTAVSAGIGYRSNFERALLYDIYNKRVQDDQMGQFERLGYFDSETNKMRMNSNISSMYRSMSKQAMAMSAVGGITSFGANAIGNVANQMVKEGAIKNKPASLSKNGNWFGLVTSGLAKIYYLEMICDDTDYELYANIFKKYGYSINCVMLPNLKSRKYFNYIKTNGAILTGDVNQSILAKLASIFDNGVTIWHMDYTTKDTLYTYEKENIERTLLSVNLEYDSLLDMPDTQNVNLGSTLKIAIAPGYRLTYSDGEIGGIDNTYGGDMLYYEKVFNTSRTCSYTLADLSSTIATKDVVVM